ncbi:hypothetical protein BSKO_02512 [Bryopsis sp. KO-2023]|nr:hypothetical protein BSKO_02512 [Bryopsis sp. KO-2023]
MSDSELQQEWRLPINVIVSTLAKLRGKSIARCSPVSSTWLAASQDPQLSRKLRIERNWHSIKTTPPLKINFHCRPITSTALAKDRVAVGGDNWLKVWDLEAGEWRVSCQGVSDGICPCLAFTEGGWLVRVSNQDHGSYITGWKADEAFRSFYFRAHPKPLQAIVGVGENMIASGGYGEDVILWKLDHLTNVDPMVGAEENVALPCEAVFEGHFKPVHCLTATHDGRYLLSKALDGTIRVWNIHTKTCENILQGYSSSFVLSVAAYGDQLASCYNLKVRLWKFLEPSSKCVQTFEGLEGGISILWFDQDRVVTLDVEDGRLCVWDVESGGRVGGVQFPREGFDFSVWCSSERMVVVGRSWMCVWNFDYV